MQKIFTLFAIIISFNTFADLEEQMVRQNLKRDSKKCPGAETYPEGQYTIRGSMNYMDSFKGRYHYEASVENGEVTLTTKIFFRNVKNLKIAHDNKDYLNVIAKVKWAQDYWNEQVPPYMNLKFKFEVVATKEEAFFKPALVRKKVRGPYYAGWYTEWDPIVVAHEIGHMFGLDDEYHNSPFGVSLEACDYSSLMCSNHPNSRLKTYHFDLILRRLSCY